MNSRSVNPDRRTMLASLGLSMPMGWSHGGREAIMRFQSVEDSVREAFATRRTSSAQDLEVRIPVGHSPLLEQGVQGCLNDRPFAGFAKGALLITRVSMEPGPVTAGARLFNASVTIRIAEAEVHEFESRYLNFALLPAAPLLALR